MESAPCKLRLALVFLPLLSLGACRVPIGNKVKVDQPQSTSLTGYYHSSAERLTFCATIDGQSASCIDANTATTPSLVASTMTDPVVFVIGDEPGTAALVDKSLSRDTMLGVAFNPADRTFLAAYYGVFPAWPTAPLCNYRIDLAISDGKVRVDRESVADTREIRGRLALRFTYRFSFEGSCAAARLEMKACYENTAQCPAPSQGTNWSEQVATYFDTWIDAHAHSSGDIPNIKALSYEVLYQ